MIRRTLLLLVAAVLAIVAGVAAAPTASASTNISRSCDIRLSGITVRVSESATLSGSFVTGNVIIRAYSLYNGAVIKVDRVVDDWGLVIRGAGGTVYESHPVGWSYGWVHRPSRLSVAAASLTGQQGGCSILADYS